MMTEAKILLKAIEGCVQDAMDGAPLVRAKYLSRFRLCLNVLQGIANDLLGYKLYEPQTSDDRVGEIISKLAINLRAQSASRTYLRQAEVVAEDIMSLIHKRPAAAKAIRKHHLALLSVLVIMDTAGARMYKEWSTYIKYVAGELGIENAQQYLRWKALDLITFRLTEGKNKVELSNGTNASGDIVLDVGGLAPGVSPGPLILPNTGATVETTAAMQRNLQALFPTSTICTSATSTPVTIYAAPPNAKACPRAAFLQSAATRFGPGGANSSASGAWLPGE
jgi:hypothetical protein